MKVKIPGLFLLSATLATSLTGGALAGPLATHPAFLRGAVNDAVTTRLTGDLPRALASSRDEGPLNDGVALAHIRLEMTRPADKQAALDRLTRDQYVRGSSAYHHWLTPAQLRAYGPAQRDIDAVVAWLTRNGLKVNAVSPSGMSIDFGGRAGLVASAFHTQMHFALRTGEAHIANVTAPAIPAALAPVVAGVTLSNFFPKPAMQRRIPAFTAPTSDGTFYAVAPADFAKIYNIGPLRGNFNFFHHSVTGAGVTIAVVEQTRILPTDWQTFRRTFGLSGYHGKLTVTHPGGCASPGFTGDEGEAALDAEWSSAAAPDADIIEASCATAAPLEFGVEAALQNLVELGTPATIFSVSYGGPERQSGFAFEAGWTNLVQEGAAEGKSIFVSSGDSGSSADESSRVAPYDVDGLDINGLADTAYNVSVGGTDFYDTALKQNTKYWNAKNTASLGSAKSYVPEIPWNNSCAGSILYKYLGYAGPLQLCNSAAANGLQNDIGGTGGQSDYYTKPDWQLKSILGMPNDNRRDQPDVSLFAANGLWAHFYVLCMSDAAEGGSPCHYSNQNDLFGNAAGGTSFSAPAFAGIAALIQQSIGFYYGTEYPLGNPNPIFYRIADAQFKTPIGLSGCNSTLGDKISPVCAFNYVTAGDNYEPCVKGSMSCYTSALSTKGIGVLKTTVAGKSEFGFPAQPGYSLATGLGTVNVANLVYSYSDVFAP